jgi:DNA topoisomerase I
MDRTLSPAAVAAARVFLRAARKAGLRYTDDTGPGIRRVGAPGRFHYTDARGRRITDPDTLARVRRLAIPPAWTDVWINPSGRGHIQARGRDARGRKQYRYHDDWRATRDLAKFNQLVPFAQALPALRRAVRRDLTKRSLTQDKVVAVIVRLLEVSLIRVGNEEYARSNRSYGLTTLRDHHATIRGGTVRLKFPGKSGIRHEVELKDGMLARVIQRTQDLPGQELFQYVDDDGVRHRLRSDDVNRYLRRHMGATFTAKTFRTWSGTVWAAVALSHLPPPTSATNARRQVMAAVRVVAERLRNTPTVCRSSYIHPAVLESYAAGREILPRRATPPDLANPPVSLSAAEKAVLKFLRHWRPSPAAAMPAAPRPPAKTRRPAPTRRSASSRTRQAA